MISMIADQPMGGTRLGVGFDARGRSRNEAWKASIGNKQGPARFDLLPEGAKRWNRIGGSEVLQILMVTFFVVMRIFFPARLTVLQYQVTLLRWVVVDIPIAPS